MVDLETLGGAPNAVFPSLAAVQFDLETGEFGSRFSMNIDIDSAIKEGLVFDSSTVGWWFTQPPEVARLMFRDPKPLYKVLKQFKKFIKNIALESSAEFNQDDIVLWGNSARYDLAKLEWAYKAVELEVPWNTWNEKCYRTLTKHFPQFGNNVQKHEMKHDPIQDCEFQIRKLVEVNKKVCRRNYEDSQFETSYTDAILLLSNLIEKGVDSEWLSKAKRFMEGPPIEEWLKETKTTPAPKEMDTFDENADTQQ